MIDRLAAQLDPQTVAAVARRALNRPALALDRWRVEPIDYVNVSPHSRGLYRVSGSARDGGSDVLWSAVLKVVAASPDEPIDRPARPFYWRREALIYQSGWLAALPESLAAPRCLAVTERPSRQLWLWLEDIAIVAEPPWLLPRYAQLAHSLGQFGVAWRERAELRTTPWLSRSLLRAWIADAAGQIALLEHPAIKTDPLLRDLYPADLIAGVRRLWSERELFCAALEQLPQTLCHHDLWRNNLAARLGPHGQPQTVLFDWEVAGLGAPGEDVGNLLGVSLLNLDCAAEQAAALAETLLRSYLAGLRVAGGAGEAAVRGAFAAAAALRCVFSATCWPVAIVRDESGRFRRETEQRWQRPIEAIFAQWASLTHFLLERVAKARPWLGLQPQSLI